MYCQINNNLFRQSRNVEVNFYSENNVGIGLGTMTKLQKLFITASDCCGLRDTVTLNEIADSLAKQAAITDFTGPEPVLGLSIKSVKEHCSPMVGSRTDKKMEQYSELLTSEAKYCNSTQFAKYAIRLSRKDFKILVGLLTGHNTLNQQLTLLKIKRVLMCPLCGGEEYDTSLHLLGRCSALVGKQRKQF